MTINSAFIYAKKEEGHTPLSSLSIDSDPVIFS